MTQKELLYLEDAVNHECYTIDICTFIKDSIKDSTLSKFVNKEIKKHELIKEKLLNIMEVKANDR